MGMVEQVKHRWHRYRCGTVQNAKVDAFLAEVAEVSKRHGLSIYFNTQNGEIGVNEFDANDIDALMAADDCTRVGV